MTQLELERAVARMTGEDITTIRGRGFSSCSAVERAEDGMECEFATDELPPPWLDWDAYDLERNVAVVEQPRDAWRRSA